MTKEGRVCLISRADLLHSFPSLPDDGLLLETYQDRDLIDEGLNMMDITVSLLRTGLRMIIRYRRR